MSNEQELLESLTDDDLALLRQLKDFGSFTTYQDGGELPEKGLITANLVSYKIVVVKLPEPHEEETKRFELTLTELGQALLDWDRSHIPEWVKLVMKDDWGTLYFARPCFSQDTSRLEEQGISLKKDVRIRWPDGSESVEKSGFYTHRTTVSDHGHSYGVSCEVPCVMASLRGVESQTELSDVEIHKDSFEKLP